MAYTHLTYAGFRTELSNRLSDPDKVFFTDDELKRFTIEALRFWNCLTGFWRDRATFNTAAGTDFYDLPTLAEDGGGNLLRPYTVTDIDLITEMQYHLLEPAGFSFRSTEMFELVDYVSALNRRRNQFLAETGCAITEFTQAVNTGLDGRVTLPDSVIDVRRVAWIGGDGSYTPLWRDDEYALNRFKVGWVGGGAHKPSVYSVTATQPLTLQFDAVNAIGTLHILAVQAATSSLAGIFMVSDDFNRPDGPLGSKWTTYAGEVSIVNHQAKRTGPGGLNEVWYDTDLPEDQWVELTWQSGSYVDLKLRGDGADSHWFFSVNATNDLWYIIDSQGAQLIDSHSGGTPIPNGRLMPGDVLRFEAQGTTFRVFWNGYKLWEGEAPSIYPTGGGGLKAGFNLDSMTVTAIDNFKAGGFTSGTNIQVVPDDYAWAIKYGALADMLSKESDARYPELASYCQTRYEQGVELARMAVSTVNVLVNGVSVPVEAVVDLDTYQPLWQYGAGQAGQRGQPSVAFMAGLNLMGLAKVPNDSYGVTVDLVRNAPVPTADGDYIQLGREELDAVLDYAQHVCALKQGGDAFAATAPCLQRVIKLAGVYNEKLKANAVFLRAMSEMSQKEEQFRPRREAIGG